jgi:putative heme-binding domain-containing protein
MRRVSVLLLAAFILARRAACAEDPPNQTNFFLPQNPVAAAYVLGRLSNQELIEAPRSEFVYVALLQRKGLDRKYRIEALDGLARIRQTDVLAELLRGLVELDRKGDESAESLRELASILLQSGRPEMLAKRSELDRLALGSQLSLTRQIVWAARVTAEGAIEGSWRDAEPNPAQLEDLLLGIPLITDAGLRAASYTKLKPMLLNAQQSALRRAAIIAIAAVPGHEEETFNSLAALVRDGVEVPAAIASLGRIPRSSWPKEALIPLSQSVVEYLQKVPAEQRIEPPFANALQFATELAALLPPDAERAMTRTLRTLGPTVVTLHAVYEQMRFDKTLIAVEAGKPLALILQNDDAMPHNLAVLAPGALQEIGLAAEKMSPEPDSQGRLYVPASPKVLQATRLASQGQKVQLTFNAPEQPGDYPFVCTFPGHWLRMSGTLAVVPDVEAYLASHPLSQQPKLVEWKLADLSPDLDHAASSANLPTGKELFSKLACFQCHKLGSQGYSYGPDLTEVFKRHKNDRAAVLEQILEPSKVIEERYRNFNFELNNGDSVLGLILKDDNLSVTIQTGPADSLIQVLKKSEIRRQRAQTSSPMPVGLLNSLTKSEIFDLLAYLESGGNIPPHDHAHVH